MFVLYKIYVVSQQIVINVSKIKGEGRTYLTKLIGAFRDSCERVLNLSSHFTGNTIFCFLITKSSRLILCWEMIRVSYENQRKHVHKLCVTIQNLMLAQVIRIVIAGL